MAKSKAKAKSTSTSAPFDQRRHQAQNARAKVAKRAQRRKDEVRWLKLKCELAAAQTVLRELAPDQKEEAKEVMAIADAALAKMRAYPKYKYTNMGKKYGAGKWKATTA